MKKLTLIILLAFIISFVPSLIKLGTTENSDNCYKSTSVYASTDLKDWTFDTSKISLDPNPNDDEETRDYFKSDKPIVAFILMIINVALITMGSIAIIILIIGGFMMMFSQGNQQKLDEAKDVVKYAMIGLIVAFLSYIIVLFVQSLFVSAESKNTTLGFINNPEIHKIA